DDVRLDLETHNSRLHVSAVERLCPKVCAAFDGFAARCEALLCLAEKIVLEVVWASPFIALRTQCLGGLALNKIEAAYGKAKQCLTTSGKAESNAAQTSCSSVGACPRVRKINGKAQHVDFCSPLLDVLLCPQHSMPKTQEDPQCSAGLSLTTTSN